MGQSKRERRGKAIGARPLPNAARFSETIDLCDDRHGGKECDYDHKQHESKDGE